MKEIVELLSSKSINKTLIWEKFHKPIDFFSILRYNIEWKVFLTNQIHSDKTLQCIY